MNFYELHKKKKENKDLVREPHTTPSPRQIGSTHQMKLELSVFILRVVGMRGPGGGGQNVRLANGQRSTSKARQKHTEKKI